MDDGFAYDVQAVDRNGVWYVGYGMEREEYDRMKAFMEFQGAGIEQERRY